MTSRVDPLGAALPGGLTLLGPVGTLLLLRALRTAEHTARQDGIRANADVVRLRSILETAATDARTFLGETAKRSGPNNPPCSAQRSSLLVDPIGAVEAARMLGYSPQYVRTLCRRRDFASAQRRSGRGWLIERDEVATRQARTRHSRRRVGRNL